MMASHHIHTCAHSAEACLCFFSLIVSQIYLIQISPLSFELEAIRVENTLFCWCRSKLSPFGILTRRCPHQLFNVSQRGPPLANKSEISLTSKASRKDGRPHVGLPHPIPPPFCYTNRLAATRLDSDLVDEEIQIRQPRLARPRARAEPCMAAGLPR